MNTVDFAKRHGLGHVTAAAALCLAPVLALAQAPIAPGDVSAPTALTAPAAPTKPAAVDATAATAAPAADEASSYSVGLTFGSQLRKSGLEQSLSLDAIARGMKDGLAGKALTPDDQDRAMQLLRAGRDAVAGRNRVAASAFLAQNGTVNGVVTTASGLQYTIVKEGDTKAPSPSLKDRVTVHYRGRLLDGTEFDSSDKHQQAATFRLDGVLKGWREALQLMKPGSQWRVFIPPELAYGDNTPQSIPPGSMLVFDVELVRVEPPPVLGAQPGKKPPASKPTTAQQPTG